MSQHRICEVAILLKMMQDKEKFSRTKSGFDQKFEICYKNLSKPEKNLLLHSLIIASS